MIRIEKWLAINNFIVLVYYSPRSCYKFSIINQRGKTFTGISIYYSAEAAELEAKEVIKEVTN